MHMIEKGSKRQDNVQKLETGLTNAHLSFKKFDAGSQKINEI